MTARMQIISQAFNSLYMCIYGTGLQLHPPRHGHGSAPPVGMAGGVAIPGI